MIPPGRLGWRMAGGAISLLVATSAMASETKSAQISGTLSGKCRIEFLCPGQAACSTIKFSAKLGSPRDTPNDSTGDVKWSCNLAGQPVTLTFSSRNSGVLKSSKASIRYKVGFVGTNATSFSGLYLDSPRSTTGISTAAMTPFLGTLRLTTEPGPNIQAGEYTDMISVTITPSGL